MGLFGKKEETPVVVEETPVVEEVVLPVKHEGTVIAEGVTFVGDFFTEEQMDIVGAVRGNIKSTVDTHIAKTGKHIGKIDTNSLHTDGVMESDVICADLAALSETAVFTGTLLTANFDASHGSNFNGTLSIKNAAKPQPALIEDGDVPVTEEDIFGTK